MVQNMVQTWYKTWYKHGIVKTTELRISVKYGCYLLRVIIIGAIQMLINTARGITHSNIVVPCGTLFALQVCFHRSVNLTPFIITFNFECSTLFNLQR
jgi:hypothetical protein